MKALFTTWRDATFSPRTGFPRLVKDEPRLATLTFSVAWGILQSLMQGARNSVGAASPVWRILVFSALIGTLWGLLQLHLVAGALFVVARSPDGERIPFRRVRNLVALSSAPSTYALTAWLLGTLFLGRALYVAPEMLASLGMSPTAALELGLLYLGTVACLLWSVVLLVLGIKVAEETTIGGALSTALLAVLVVGGAAFVLVVIALVFAGVFRASPAAV